MLPGLRAKLSCRRRLILWLFRSRKPRWNSSRSTWPSTLPSTRSTKRSTSAASHPRASHRKKRRSSGVALRSTAAVSGGLPQISRKTTSTSSLELLLEARASMETSKACGTPAGGTPDTDVRLRLELADATASRTSAVERSDVGGLGAQSSGSGRTIMNFSAAARSVTGACSRSSWTKRDGALCTLRFRSCRISPKARTVASGLELNSRTKAAIRAA
mmetsp:Transcript_2427/g.7496  ORF Transcript_2427/g.7496 Transcript_2427/m.7496 type:complete len:217 (-) Transcript_2427:223-873(-)